MDFRQLILTPAYDFLRENEHLNGKILLLGLGGSHAYGTSRPESDIDLRGIALQSVPDLLGMTSFEQYEDRGTDTVIYGFNKMIRLLLECNPNTIELLGLNEDQYLIRTELGQELLDRKQMFFSQRAAKSFRGYAQAQLRRLQNASARDSMTQSEREKHICSSVRNSMEECQQRCAAFRYGTLSVYTDKAENPELETEIFVDADYRHMPLRDYTGLLNQMNQVVREYSRNGQREQKKDADHLNKHAMHLIRLYLMAIDLLEKGEIRTHRTEDLPLLRSIRQGEFLREDGTLSSEFYKLAADHEKRLDYAAAHTLLPEQPDMEGVERFVEYVNRRTVNGEY